jgi:hypothetical protein
MTFRHVVGWMYALIAIIFLSVNSYVLGSFGYKFAHDQIAKYGFALVAGSVPWAMAPHLHVMAAKTRMLRMMTGKPTIWRRVTTLWRSFIGMIPFIIIYVLFVGYNVLGGTGATAFQRQELNDERKHAADDNTRTEQRRKALQDQLNGIPKHRPKDAIQPLLEATKLHRFWIRTNECTDVTAKQSRDFCAEVLGLRAEMANADKADKLLTELKGLDDKLSDSKAPTTAEDPQIAFLADFTGAKPRDVFFVLLLSTPLILEVGALLFGKQALELLNVHLVMEPAETVIPPTHHLPPPRSPRPTRLQATSIITPSPDGAPPAAIHGSLAGEDHELQVAVYERFWADCTRRMPGGKEPVTAVYAAYRGYCAAPQNGVMPLPFADFARRAGDHVERTSTIGTTTWLCGFVMSEPMGVL